MVLLQKETWNAVTCRSIPEEEPIIVGLFCRKRPREIRHPMPLCHSVHSLVFHYTYLGLVEYTHLSHYTRLCSESLRHRHPNTYRRAVCVCVCILMRLCMYCCVFVYVLLCVCVCIVYGIDTTPKNMHEYARVLCVCVWCVCGVCVVCVCGVCVRCVMCVCCTCGVCM